jgi:hypothetical protein
VKANTEKNINKFPMVRMGTLSLDAVLLHLATELEERQTKRGSLRVRRYHKFDEFELKINSLRLITFKVKGIKCVQCGIEGTFFAIETAGGIARPPRLRQGALTIVA